MNVSIFSFTQKGAILSDNLYKILISDGHEADAYSMKKYTFATEFVMPYEKDISGYVGENFNKGNVLLFVGAAGIAVRLIAPFIKDKTRDPACIVLDELGKYAVPILSGHIGSANEFAAYMCDKICAYPIITTATDINGVFSIDTWAHKNNIHISDMKYAKLLSAALLNNECLRLKSDFNILSPLPTGIYMSEKGRTPDIYITIKNDDQASYSFLRLIPRIVTLGIGCKKDTPKELIHNLYTKVLTEYNISPNSIKGLSSIDIKASEKGLLEFANNKGLSLTFFTKEELLQQNGSFSSSDFVKSVVGVDNVCERAALALANKGALLALKTKLDGVTMALGIEDWSVCFE